MNGDERGAHGGSADAASVNGTGGNGGGASSAGTDGWQGEPSLIDFPATIDVKAMGLADTGFEALVTSLVLPHVASPGPESVTRRESSAGKYVSVRVRFVATSKNQLETIYGALRAEPRVLFTL